MSRGGRSRPPPEILPSLRRGQTAEHGQLSLMRPTIDDVARTAGTSTKTVSRVLNNEPNVRERMRQRVLAAVAALKYRPLASARSLATNRSFMIGLLYDNL